MYIITHKLFHINKRLYSPTFPPSIIHAIDHPLKRPPPSILTVYTNKLDFLFARNKSNFASTVAS